MKLFLSLFMATIIATNVPVEAGEKPNIVLLFADDAGYGDFGFHGRHYSETPRLERSAELDALLSDPYVTVSNSGLSCAGVLTRSNQHRVCYE